MVIDHKEAFFQSGKSPFYKTVFIRGSEKGISNSGCAPNRKTQQSQSWKMKKFI
jgi:hypothetical protein